VAWQSSIAVVIGLVVGVALGIVAGRFLWDLLATNTYVVPSLKVPALAIVASRSVPCCSATWLPPFREFSRPVHRQRWCCGPSKNALRKATPGCGGGWMQPCLR
jgi:hypothetical protein